MDEHYVYKLKFEDENSNNLPHNWSLDGNGKTAYFDYSNLDLDIKRMCITLSTVLDNSLSIETECLMVGNQVSGSKMSFPLIDPYELCNHYRAIYIKNIYFISNDNQIQHCESSIRLYCRKEINPELFYDLTFQVNDKELHAHRAIVASNCSYFADV